MAFRGDVCGVQRWRLWRSEVAEKQSFPSAHPVILERFYRESISYITHQEAATDLLGLKSSLETRIAETDTYVESKVKIYSYRTSCGMIKSVCWDYKITNEFTNDIYWYRYSTHGNIGFQLAKNKEIRWEIEAKSLFKGPRLDEALAYLTENIEGYSN